MKLGWRPLNPELHFHDLRHMHETWLIEDQVPRVVRLARLSHKRKDVDDNYSHVTDVMITRMLAGLQRRWEEDGDGRGSEETGRQRHERLGIANVFIRPCSPFAPRNDKRPADGIHRQAA
ncbi:hypothetical protein [Lentzea cavernae]|uniref:hypothetical protein n=1 Tax=Lentzea cavernae TaxID=2020703 RepID=UPI00174AF6F6|nr:hypothetical protein [Lentzea cavernae]